MTSWSLGLIRVDAEKLVWSVRGSGKFGIWHDGMGEIRYLWLKKRQEGTFMVRMINSVYYNEGRNNITELVSMTAISWTIVKDKGW